MNSTDAPTRYVQAPTDDPAAFALKVDGKAMEPDFRDGEIVVFSPAAPVESGDDCVVYFRDDKPTFRRVMFLTCGRVRLHARNPWYEGRIVAKHQIVRMVKAIWVKTRGMAGKR